MIKTQILQIAIFISVAIPDIAVTMSTQSQTQKGSYTHLSEFTPSDIPNFSNENTEEWIKQMTDWISETINQNTHKYEDSYRSISYRTNIAHYTYSKSPVLPSPKTFDRHGASTIRVDLTGTVEVGTRHKKNPVPVDDDSKNLWNFITMFAHVTGAEIRTQFSQQPRDNFSVYMFYEP